jgi:hypothetical protein
VLECARRFSEVLHEQLHDNSKLFDVEEGGPVRKLRRRLSEASDFQDEELHLSATLTALVKGLCRVLLRACLEAPASISSRYDSREISV